MRRLLERLLNSTLCSLRRDVRVWSTSLRTKREPGQPARPQLAPLQGVRSSTSQDGVSSRVGTIRDSVETVGMIRPYDQMLDPDPRFAAMIWGNDGRPITCEEHYRAVAGVAIRSAVSGPVRTTFERARSAFLYAWFDYELTTLAQGQACGALELALRAHLKARYPDKTFASLNTCLEKAIADGDFDDLRFRLGDLPHDVGDLTNLRMLLVGIRNEVGHGSDMVMPPAHALDILIFCAGMIDHLQGSRLS